jgi:hypothetical protein
MCVGAVCRFDLHKYYFFAQRKVIIIALEMPFPQRFKGTVSRDFMPFRMFHQGSPAKSML